jgi:hypothetical protein
LEKTQQTENENNVSGTIERFWWKLKRKSRTSTLLKKQKML